MARNYWKSSSRTLVLRNRSRSVVFETHFESLRKWSKSHLKVRFERRHLIWMVTLKSGKANDERHFEQRDPSFSKRLHSCCLFFPRTYEVICHWLGLSYFRYTSRTISAVLLNFRAISRDQTAVGILWSEFLGTLFVLTIVRALN